MHRSRIRFYPYNVMSLTFLTLALVISNAKTGHCAQAPSTSGTGSEASPSNGYTMVKNGVHAPPMMMIRTPSKPLENIIDEERGNIGDTIIVKDSPQTNIKEIVKELHAEEESKEFSLLHGVGDAIPEALLMAFHSQIQDDKHIKPMSFPVDQILDQLKYLYLPDTTLINNTQCKDDLDIIFRLSPENIMETIALVDSWGKFPDGILGGNTHVFGSFDECLKVKYPRDSKDPSLGSFTGQYCSVRYSKIKKSNETLDEIEVQLAPVIIGPFEDLAGTFLYGTCMPSSCASEDLKISINHHIQKKHPNITVSSADCQLDDHQPFEFTPGAIVMIMIFAVEGSLILGSGLLDMWIHYTGKEELRKGPLRYVLVFSLATNLEKMFRINTKESKDSITSFYGMRVLSMTWVMMGHQYMMTKYYSANKNMVKDEFNGHFFAQIILNAYPSVETFFFMSGFLVAYVFFKEQERTGKFNIFLFYFHRFIRLSPPIMLWSGFLATFYMQIVRGPRALSAAGSMESCQKYWYRDAFFMSNFGGYGNDDKGRCLGVSWYTSVDSQIYLASPFFLLPFIFKDFFDRKFSKRINIGAIWLGIMVVISVIIPMIVIAVHHLPPNPVRNAVDTSLHHKLVYYRPWCRATPYLVGMCLAYFLRTNKKEVKLSAWQVILGWLVAIGLGIVVVFGMYNYNQEVGDPIPYHWAPSIFYGGLHGLCWGLAIAWVVFACQFGYGGPINTFLSHPSFQPLNRLTYCIFLVALSLQGIIFNYNMVFASYYSHLNKVIEIVGVLFISGIGGILLSLFTEGPILGLERLLLKK